MAHKFKCTGMQNILNGFLRYRANLRGQLIKKFEEASQCPNPQNIIITCVDSRIVASRVAQTNPGETFLSRNPGNLIPNYNILNPKTPRPEAAALELACVYNNVDTIVLTGHADCKAMNLVYDNRKVAQDKPKPGEKESVLKTWLMSNTKPTIAKFAELENSNFKKKLTINISDKVKFDAFIDPENQYAENDKFSQLNTLTQLENLKHFSFMKDLLDKDKLNIYAMWLDIYCGEVFVFSYKAKRFIRLNDSTYEALASDSLVNN